MVLVVRPAQSAWWFVDYLFLYGTLSDSQQRFRLDGNVSKDRLCFPCPIILQARAYRLIEPFDEYTIKCLLVLDVCDTTRLCNKVVAICLVSHVD